MSREATEFQLRAADAAMFATANPSVGGFDVRCWKARPFHSLPAVAGIRYGMFDVRGEIRRQPPMPRLRRAREIGESEVGETAPIETRSLPALARCFPRSSTFYVADPSAPFANLLLVVDGPS